MRLQIVRSSRAARHAGLPPVVAVVLLIATAALVGAFLYARLGGLTPAFVTGGAIVAALHLTAPGRASWRETILGPPAAARWRYVEIGAVTALAAGLLLLLDAPRYLLVLLPLNGLLAWRPELTRLRGATDIHALVGRLAPFGKTPYAFVAGLRRTWPYFVVLSLVLAQAVRVSNANLAIVTCLAWLLLPAGFYSETEPEYLLRMNTRSAARFLRAKCLTGLRQHAVLGAVPLLLTAVCFPTHARWLLLAVAYVALVHLASIGRRYRTYPSPPNLPESLLFAFAMVSPFLPVYAWWSLRTASRRLNRYLP